MTKRRDDKEFIQKISTAYLNGESVWQIGKIFKSDCRTINLILFEDLKLEKRSPSGFYEETEREIVDLYLNNKKQEEIAEIFNTTKHTILKILKKYKIKTKKRCDWTNFNHFFFKDGIIDENTAYIFGMWMADGYNDVKGRSAILALHAKDEDLMFKIAKILDSPKPKLVNNKSLLKIACGSKYFCNDLESLGCIQNKSLILKWPDIPDQFLNHFVRGYFDGDGCFHISQNNQVHVTILGTEDFCQNLNLKLSNVIDGIKNLQLHPNKITRRYFFGGNKQVKKFAEWLYKDATIYMERKFKKIEHLLIYSFVL